MKVPVERPGVDTSRACGVQGHQELARDEPGPAHMGTHPGNVASARIHIIMPVLNEETALRVLLPRLPLDLRSSMVLVDNGSTDDSLLRAAPALRGVELIRLSTNVGFAKANNIGAQAACRVNHSRHTPRSAPQWRQRK